MSTPETVAFTAQARIAPAAMSTMLTPSPMKPPSIETVVYPLLQTLNLARSRRFERPRFLPRPASRSSSLGGGAQGIDLRARRVGDHLLGLPLPGPARRRRGWRADPRAHEAGDRLDGGPGDPRHLDL